MFVEILKTQDDLCVRNGDIYQAEPYKYDSNKVVLVKRLAIPEDKTDPSVSQYLGSDCRILADDDYRVQAFLNPPVVELAGVSTIFCITSEHKSTSKLSIQKKNRRSGGNNADGFLESAIHFGVMRWGVKPLRKLIDTVLEKYTDEYQEHGIQKGENQ